MKKAIMIKKRRNECGKMKITGEKKRKNYIENKSETKSSTYSQ
jgi:hypothetical protein